MQQWTIVEKVVEVNEAILLVEGGCDLFMEGCLKLRMPHNLVNEPEVCRKGVCKSAGKISLPPLYLVQSTHARPSSQFWLLVEVFMGMMKHPSRQTHRQLVEILVPNGEFLHNIRLVFEELWTGKGLSRLVPKP